MSGLDKKQDVIDGVTTKETNIDKSKRKFSKAGLTAPVIMTLASKPVFAAQGLSNMISGNASVCRGDIFEGGFNRAFWADDTTNANHWRLATGTTGTDYQLVTVASAFGLHTHPGASASTLLSIIQTSAAGWEIVVGYLNLFYYLNSAAGTYFLTEAQFWDLNDGVISVPSAYTNFADLIISNVGLAPGDVCP